MAQDRDLLDQLARSHPGEFGRFDGAVEASRQRRETRALGGKGGRLGGVVFARRLAQLLDLRVDRGKLGTQRFGGLGRIVQDGLDVDTQAAQLFLDLRQVLDRLLSGLDGSRQPRDVVGDFGRQPRLCQGRLRAFRRCGWGLNGRWRLSCNGCKRGNRDQQRGKQNRASTPKMRVIHSLTAWPKLRGWRAKTGAEASAGSLSA